MRPVLLDLGFFKIYSWGFMLAVAVLVGTYLAAKEARKEGLDIDKVYDLIIVAVGSGVIGARLFYVFFYDWAYFQQNLLEIVMLQKGGLVWYGGFFGGFTGVTIYLFRHNLRFWQIADLLAPYLALGYGFVRIGCFLNGCCWGVPTDLPWAVVFPHLDELPRHPTQLYSSALGFSLFFILMAYKERRPFVGAVFLLYLGLYAIGRGLIESLRENLIVFDTLTISQLISVIAVAIVIPVFWSKWKQKKQMTTPK